MTKKELNDKLRKHYRVAPAPEGTVNIYKGFVIVKSYYGTIKGKPTYAYRVKGFISDNGEFDDNEYNKYDSWKFKHRVAGNSGLDTTLKEVTRDIDKYLAEKEEQELSNN